jgi:hypothetical protein
MRMGVARSHSHALALTGRVEVAIYGRMTVGWGDDRNGAGKMEMNIVTLFKVVQVRKCNGADQCTEEEDGNELRA